MVRIPGFTITVKDEIKEITNNLLENVKKRLNEKNIEIEFTDSVVSELSEKGFDKVYGARPLRRLITSEIEDMLSEKILLGELNKKEYICDFRNKKYILK